MTLDEAIRHLIETLTNPAHEWNCPECKAEHEQLLMWLKDYKRLLERPQGECEKCTLKHTEKCDICVHRLAKMKGGAE